MDTSAVFTQLMDAYGINGEVSSYRKITNGHINTTYCVVIGANEYIFQKINSYVFKDPVVVMKNIKTVANYIINNNIKSVCKIVRFLENKENINYTILDNGDFWRLCKYETGTVAVDTVTDSAILKNSGYAFGDFLNAISGLCSDRLHITIPDFHNTRKRMDDFFAVVEANKGSERAKEVEAEIDLIKKHRDFCSKLTDMTDSGELPLRPVHNDTKYNNILLDEKTFDPVCVIDLDTIMPGLVAHDFGDAIRFAANTAAEDEADLTKVSMDVECYKQFTAGFVGRAKKFLTPKEIETLAYGVPTITLELASRFLADYINGDKYFTIHYPNHNLVRAKCQLKLAEDMFSKLDEMKAYVISCI